MSRIGVVSDVTFLAPCVSHNRRLYTADMCRKAGARLIERVADPTGLPVTVRTHHEADDDSAKITGRVANPKVSDDGVVTGDVYIADTGAGRDMLALTTPDQDGKRFLDSMSIRGYFLGDLQTVERDGESLVTAPDMEIDGVDWTASPGVDQARLAQVRQSREAAESTGRTPITESIAPAPVVLDATVEADAPPVSKRGSGTKGTGGPFADPGHKPDGKQRFQIDTKAHCKAALSMINNPANQKGYTAAQLASVKKKIAAAAKGFGIFVAGESAAEPTVAEQLADAVAALEATVGVSAMQGPADVDVRAFGVDNADVAAATTLIGQAAAAALQVLDPDHDGDMDLPDGDVDGDEDGPVDTLCAGCLAPLPDDATFCPSCGAQVADESAPTPDQEITEMGPTKCGGCGSDVPAGAKFCPNCGAQTKQAKSSGGKESSTTTTTSEESPVTETDQASPTPLSDDDVTRIAKQLAAAMAPAEPTPDPVTPVVTDAAPAPAAPATETAPAAAEATPAVDVAAMVAAAVTKSQEAMTAGFGKVLQEALTEQRDTMRQEILDSAGPQRRGLLETVQAVEADSTPLHTLPPHEAKKRHQENIANQMAFSGQFAPHLVEAVRTQHSVG